MNVPPLWPVLIKQNRGFAYSITRSTIFWPPKGEISKRQIFKASQTEYDARDKQGAQREQLDAYGCFGPLLGWKVRLRQGERELALGMDATVLGHYTTK
jgi:hypothetical protein